MPLIEEYERSGAWLFRWRSYLPFVLLPLIFFASMQYPVIEKHPSFHFSWSVLSLSVSLAGLFVRCHVVGYAAEGTSGRNTSEQLAESLTMNGFYSIVRHPLYVGNFLIALGIILHRVSPWLIVLYVAAFALYYERIMFAEEAFLRQKFGRAFVLWSSYAPAFLPRFRGWQRSSNRFDWKKVLRAESAAVAVIALAFPGMELLLHWSQGKSAVEISWYWLCISGVLLYVIARAMKRNFRWWSKYEALLESAAK